MTDLTNNDLSNAEYFAQRAAQARAMSETSTDPRAAEAHREMAMRYEELAAEFDPRGPGRHNGFAQGDQATA